MLWVLVSFLHWATAIWLWLGSFWQACSGCVCKLAVNWLTVFLHFASFAFSYPTNYNELSRYKAIYEGKLWLNKFVLSHFFFSNPALLNFKFLSFLWTEIGSNVLANVKWLNSLIKKWLYSLVNLWMNKCEQMWTNV